jgi:outer membrane protein assembly factor BamB
MAQYVRTVVFSAMLIAICLPAACSGQGDSAQDGYRTLTDSRGRAVQARVLQVDGDQVTIQRRDGKRFTVPIATLSSADQESLRRPASAKTDTAKTAKSKTAKAKPAGVGSRDWNRFRGPTGMGVADVSGLPVEWSQDDGLVWKIALPGAGASSPVTFGDRIYLTSYTGFFVPDEPGGSPEELKRHLIALRLDDGQVVWDKAVAAKLPEEERIRDHGFAASSVAADEERIYAFFGKTGAFAFDHDGNQLWQADVGPKTNGWGSAASPVLYKDLVFINASVESESLVALDRKTGEQKWRAGGIREAWNTPLVVTAASGREELIVPVQGSVLAFAPDSGESLWSCKTDIGWYMVPSVVAADGVVYCLGGRSGTAALAVRAGGSGDVTATHRLWTSLKGSNVSSPVFLDGHLYWTHESREIAYCAKADTGEIIYEQRLERSGQFYASALLADGRLYYVSRNGKTFVLAAKPQFEQLAVNDLSDRGVFNASPAVAGNRLLIRSDKFLYCVGAK